MVWPISSERQYTSRSSGNDRIQSKSMTPDSRDTASGYLSDTRSRNSFSGILSFVRDVMNSMVSFIGIPAILSHSSSGTVTLTRPGSVSRTIPGNLSEDSLRNSSAIASKSPS